MKKLIVLAFVLLCGGCAAWQAMRETETAQFVKWLEGEAPGASEIAVRDGKVFVTRLDGSVERRELPGTAEDAGARFGERATAAIRRSVETGSPWPGIVGIAEAGLLALVGGYAAKKRKAHLEASELAETRSEQVDAMILGIKDATLPVGAAAEARKTVAQRISALAKMAGVEHGPNGLKARVEELCANVTKESG